MKRLLALALAWLFLLPASADARNVTERKALIVGKAALYGLGGGLVVGLASQVVKKNTKNIFVGGSLGMYVGIITGLYLVMTAGSSPKEYEGPDTYEDFSGWDSYLRAPTSEALQAMQPKEDRLELSLIRASF